MKKKGRGKDIEIPQIPELHRIHNILVFVQIVLQTTTITAYPEKMNTTNKLTISLIPECKLLPENIF